MEATSPFTNQNDDSCCLSMSEDRRGVKSRRSLLRHHQARAKRSRQEDLQNFH
jgi:hypothetical protein